MKFIREAKRARRQRLYQVRRAARCSLASEKINSPALPPGLARAITSDFLRDEFSSSKPIGLLLPFSIVRDVVSRVRASERADEREGEGEG